MEERKIKTDFYVEEKVFENETTSFAVLKGKNKNNISFIAVGSLASVDEGEVLSIIGKYVKNEVYGNQFKVLEFKRKLPTTKKAMAKFLASGRIKGVSIKIAEKIVEHFGQKSFDVLENSPQRLCEIKGIGLGLIQKIEKDIKNFLTLKKLNIFLEQFKISAKICLRIWKKWGVFSLQKIQQNPYCLSSLNLNIPFKKIEKIADIMHISKDCEQRVEAAAKLILAYNASVNGHSCLPKDTFYLVVASFLKQDKRFVIKTIDKLIENNIIFSKTTNKEYVFLPIYYFAEKYIAQKINYLNSFKEEIDESDFSNLIAIEEERLKINFSSFQKKAIRKAISHGVFILTGGPGTGKTTILNSVVSILEQTGNLVVICAPTGKAAKRLQEITKKEATTIHRLLGVQQIDDDEREFIHCEKNPIKADAVVVDEMSMVDCLLFKSLLASLKPSCRLILSGDVNQLPCISAGNILKNLLECGFLPCVSLKEIFRQSKESLIVKNAHNIINDKELNLNEKGKDFIFIEKNSPTEIVKEIIYILKNKLKQINMEDVQIISPCKKGTVGTIELNKTIQNILNEKTKEKREFSFGFFKFREGDRILQIKNNYDINWEKGQEKGEGIFNGEIGKILEIDLKRQIFVVDFDGKIAKIPFLDAKDIEPAFSITVHKSQGSEFMVVILPIYFKNSEFFSRNLLYTAITRAKKLLILISSKNNLTSMCKQKKVSFRYSMLKNFLLEENK